MKKFYLTFITIFSVLLICRISLAANYYVDAAKGNNLNSGTREFPVKTISKGLTIAGKGDTIFVSSGTYRETLVLTQNGKDIQNPFAIRALSGAKVNIKASDFVTGWVQHSAFIWKRSGWKVNSQQVFSEDVPLQQIGATSPLHHHKFEGKPILPSVGNNIDDMKPGSFFFDQETETLYVWLADNSNPNNHVVEASVRDFIIPPLERQFILLERLNFSHSNLTSKGYIMGIVNVWGKSWTISHCTFNYGDFAGIAIVGDGHKIQNSTFNHNGNLGININGSDESHNWKPVSDRNVQNIVLEGNETSYNNYRNFELSWQHGGIKAAVSCNDVQILQHKAFTNNGAGIWFDIYCKNIRIDRCHVSGNLVGIGYEISDDALITNNLVTRNKYHGIYISASDNVAVLNNTLDINGFGIVVHGMPRAEHPSVKNNVVMNNIIGESSLVHLVMCSDPVKGNGNKSDHNLFSPDMGKVRISWTKTESYEVNFTNLKSFSAATQQDKNSLADTPLWNNRSAGDYSMSSNNSPGVDAGTTEVDVGEKDYLGHDRKLDGKRSGKSRIDIGAYEFVSPVSSIAPSTGLHVATAQ